jgi:hypothetical protein
VNWEPIRKGEIYCSTACGCKCTWSAYKRAHANGKALAKKLGKGWKVRVWENIGWHWEVTNEVVRVSQSKQDKSYHCMLEPHYAWFGYPQSYSTPEQAISATVKMAKKEIDKVIKIRDSALKVWKAIRD